MKTKFLKAVLFTLVIGSAISCSKDNDNGVATQVTNANIILKKSNGDAASGIVVYAYDQSTWDVLGDNPLFAEGQASSNSNGNAFFSNLEYPTSFNAVNNNQNTFRFSAHYSFNGVNKKKVIAVTFNKGDQKTETLILN